MQCNEEKPELNFICHDKKKWMLCIREEINATDKNIFILLFKKKNEVEGRGAQHISLCALNKVQYA